MGALEPHADVDRIAAIVARLGSDRDYLVDPNGTWDLRTASWVLDALQEIGVNIVE